METCLIYKARAYLESLDDKPTTDGTNEVK